MKPCVLLSGGLDSCVLLTYLQHNPEHVYSKPIVFDYGQQHRVREIDAARAIADYNGVPLARMRMDDYGAMIHGQSALTGGETPVPDGHYTDASMGVTVVPCRNMTMIVFAAIHAVKHGCDTLAIAVHAGDHAIYPDCRPTFIGPMAQAIHACTGVKLLAPFLMMDKKEIVNLGREVGAPMHLSYSCYKGGPKHCGTCGTCVERREAFALSKFPDPTEYMA